MTEKINDKLEGRETMTIPVVDRRYQMTETKKAKEIIERAMNLAREEIPKGAVATYIPELGKEDPHQLGICLYPLKGDKICLGDYNHRFTMQSVSKVVMLIVALEVCGLKNVFKKVGMEDRALYYPAQLSGGQQQRVAIARAIAANPRVVFFDEPTSALDPELTGEVLDVMKKLADEGTTMVIVTHEMQFARDVADKVVFMDGGSIIEQNGAKEFFESPQQERTLQFLRRSSKDYNYYI